MDLVRFRLPLREPLVTGRGAVGHRAGVLVKLADGDFAGWGEASPLPGWSLIGLEATEADLERARFQIKAGGEPALAEAVQALAESPHARAGLAGAWADLRARRNGLPLARELAPGAASSVAVNALVAAADPDEVESQAAAAASAGHACAKLKVAAADPGADIDRVRAARSGLGSGPELRLDANGAWDRPTARRVLRAVEPLDVSYCEEPVPGLEAMADLGRDAAVPAAADESMRTRADAERALGLGLGVLVVKPQALGGPDIALAVASLAAEAGARAVVTSFADSAVGLAHALHAAAAADRGEAHGLATAGRLAQDTAEPPPVVAGRMDLPPSEGLGLGPRVGAGDGPNLVDPDADWLVLDIKPHLP